MESDLNLHDERYPQTEANSRILPRHGDPVGPVSSEEEVKTAARNVVSTVPLPEAAPVKEAQLQERHVRDIKQSSVANLSAEDFSDIDL